MPFHPRAGGTLTLEGTTYVFGEHPAAPGMPYGQAGRRATVYQLVPEAAASAAAATAGIGGRSGARGVPAPIALKVFTKSFRTRRTATNMQRLRPLASLPGLRACEGTVITPEEHAPAREHPDLAHALRMPWVEGSTWQGLVLGQQPLTAEQCRRLAQQLAHVLATMETYGIAHCDLSGPNVLVETETGAVALVDVDELYAPGVERPAALPGGSPGYASDRHRAGGLWGPYGDRFAGAVLLAEILGWADPAVRRVAFGEQYFGEDELQQACERYQVLLDALRNEPGAGVAELFASAWHAETLETCPPLAEWARRLGLPAAGVSPSGQLVGEGGTSAEHDDAGAPHDRLARRLIREAAALGAGGDLDGEVNRLNQALALAPAICAGPYARALLRRGTRREEDGDVAAALEDYAAAQAAAPAGALKDELELIIGGAVTRRDDAAARALMERATLLLARAKADEGIEALSEAHRLAPLIAGERYASALLQRGMERERQGDAAGGLADFRVAAAVAPPGPLRQEIEQIVAAAAARRPRWWRGTGRRSRAVIAASVIGGGLLLSQLIAGDTANASLFAGWRNQSPTTAATPTPAAAPAAADAASQAAAVLLALQSQLAAQAQQASAAQAQATEAEVAASDATRRAATVPQDHQAQDSAAAMRAAADQALAEAEAKRTAAQQAQQEAERVQRANQQASDQAAAARDAAQRAETERLALAAAERAAADTRAAAERQAEQAKAAEAEAARQVAAALSDAERRAAAAAEAKARAEAEQQAAQQAAQQAVERAAAQAHAAAEATAAAGAQAAQHAAAQQAAAAQAAAATALAGQARAQQTAAAQQATAAAQHAAATATAVAQQAAAQQTQVAYAATQTAASVQATAAAVNAAATARALQTQTAASATAQAVNAQQTVVAATATALASVPPPAPTNLTAFIMSRTYNATMRLEEVTVGVNWKDTATTETHYELAIHSQTTSVARLDANATSYVWTGPAGMSGVRFELKACRDQLCSTAATRYVDTYVAPQAYSGPTTQSPVQTGPLLSSTTR